MFEKSVSFSLTCSVPQLTEKHGNELLPAGKSFCLFFSFELYHRVLELYP